MLISEPKALVCDPVIEFTKLNTFSKEIETGVYLISHHGYVNLEGYEAFPTNLSVSAYGVCDSLAQLKEQCLELQDLNREFVITLKLERRKDQPRQYGWRWHKWGQYIGTFEPQCEYLYDEVGIEKVYCYHIYERVTNG